MQCIKNGTILGKIKKKKELMIERLCYREFLIYLVLFYFAIFVSFELVIVCFDWLPLFL